MKMKVLPVCFLVICFGCADAWPSMSGKTLFKFMLNSMKCDHSKELNLNVSDVKVYFFDFSKNYTREYRIRDAAEGILKHKTLDKTRKLTLFIGGFRNHIHHPTIEKVIKAYRNLNDTYLIIVDHSHYTHDNEGAIEQNYQRAVKHVYYIGKAMAEMLTDLYKGGFPAERMHCIGFSLGAQMLGHTGLLFIKENRVSIDKITGLDPAGPCFTHGLMSNQLRSSLATYVEIYHCNAGILGTSNTFGDIDFFANTGGESQPNCLPASLLGVPGAALEADCNHTTCVDIWSKTINNKNLYLAWDNKEKFKEKSVGYLTKHTTMAGYWNPGNATGIFFFSTE